MTLPRNRASNMHARRLVALAGIMARRGPDKETIAAERAKLIELTRESPVIVHTRKSLADGSQARKAHRMGRGLTR